MWLKNLACSFFLLPFVFFVALAQSATTPAPQKPADDATLRISTALVQTDVTVVDKQGKFVDGLQADQFEIKVDGKPQSLSFFQRITVGSAEEAVRLSAARGEKLSATERAATAVERGQSVVFFIDDLHLSPEKVGRVQQVVLQYIDRKMLPGDQAMIVMASGQLGFLQQFTTNRNVLRAAVARLKFNPVMLLNQDTPRMTPYEAYAIDVGQRDVIEYKILEMVRISNSPQQKDLIRSLLQQKAQIILNQVRAMNAGLFSSLEKVTRDSSALPGRKLLFFLSEGFIFDQRDSDLRARVNRVVDAAARSSVVFYTVDLRGLSPGGPEASNDDGSSFMFESTSPFRAATATDVALGEMSESLRPLRALAYDTGGRPIINTNALEKSVEQVINEYQNYYVLAWQPEEFEAGKTKFRRIEVKIKGQPQWRVMVRSGYFNNPLQPEVKTDTKAHVGTTPESALIEAVRAPYERRELPLSLYPVFKTDANASVVTLTMEAASRVAAASDNNAANQEMELVYVVLDLQGKAVASEGKKLSFAQASNVAGKLMQQFRLPLPAGTYQVRVGARDSAGRIGTKFDWIEIPALAPGKMVLSSLLMSERKAQKASPEALSDVAPEALLNVERRFARTSRLLLQLYIYNAARRTNTPEVTMEIEVLRGEKSVLSAPAHPVAVDGATPTDQISYSAEISLRGLAPGLYTLRVKAVDVAGKSEAGQSVNFLVE